MLKLITYFCFLLIITFQFTNAQTLDNSFDLDGYLGSPPSINSNGNKGTGNNLVIQPDGKIVVAIGDYGTDLHTYRYNIDGTYDDSYGTAGTAGQFCGESTITYDLKVDPDDKIVAIGKTQYCIDGVCGAYQFLMSRYLPNGELDLSFGVDGEIRSSEIFPGGLYAYGIRVHALNNGKYMIAGKGPDHKPFVARLLNNGYRDSTFAIDGVFTDVFGTGFGYVDLFVDELGRSYSLLEHERDNYIFKLSENGELIPTFGIDGRLLFSVSNRDYPKSIFVNPDESIVICGDHQWNEPDDPDFMWGGLARTNRGYVTFINPDGTLNTELEDGSIEVHFDTDSSTFVQKIIRLNTNRYMIAGKTMHEFGGKFREIAFVAQIDNNGQYCTDFNEVGYMMFDYGQLAASGWTGKIASFVDIDFTESGEVYLTGDYNPTAGSPTRKLFVLKLKDVEMSAIESDLGLNQNSTSAFTIYPNPVTDHFTIEINEAADYALFSIEGKEMQSGKLQEGTNLLEINKPHQTSAAIVQITTVSGDVLHQKIIFE
ncbi:MAG: hypothetical protein MI810_12030 [Flavobacteriales bacterium]|nr:hypothetical protein [Flavobacteriales bacterium]